MEENKNGYKFAILKRVIRLYSSTKKHHNFLHCIYGTV